jgi:hypothetical protein
MASIFLSYRRSDTGGHAGRLADALETRNGRDAVFRDVESIEAGARFDEAIERALADCRVFVPLVGDEWLSCTGPDGRSRLSDPSDYVRREVAAALRRDVAMIPVLLDGATMPPASALPAELQPFARYQAVELSDTRWDYDVERLIAAIDRGLGRVPPATDVTPASVEPGAATSTRTSRGAMLWGGLIGLAIVAGTSLWWRSQTQVTPTPVPAATTPVPAAPAALVPAPAPVPAVDGVWMLPNGSFWSIRQDGRSLVVEETHYDSHQVWMRGTGSLLEGGSIEVELVPVFDRPERMRLSYRLEPSSDGRSLMGEVHNLASGRREGVTLMRR